MFRVIGTIIVLGYVSMLLSQTFTSADSAFSAVFQTVETMAKFSQKQLEQ